MKARDRSDRGGRRVFLAGLARNPSGVPRRDALRLTLFGVALGVVGGLIAHNLPDRKATESLREIIFTTFTGSFGGAILGPLGLLLVAHALDRTVRTDDHLVGYSGLIRMLLHAGELSFLGALGGGIGAGSDGIYGGLTAAILVSSVIAAVLYRVRGLGVGLGLTIGVLMGAISGAIGVVMRQWGG